MTCLYSVAKEPTGLQHGNKIHFRSTKAKS